MKALLATVALLCLTGCAGMPIIVSGGASVTATIGDPYPAYPIYDGYPPPYAYPVPVRQDRHGHWKTLPTPGMQYRHPPRNDHPRQRPPRRHR